MGTLRSMFYETSASLTFFLFFYIMTSWFKDESCAHQITRARVNSPIPIIEN